MFIQKGNGEYDIILSPDINSKTHLQWFYFEVSGMKSGCPYTFNIINMEKTTSQFSEGKQILIKKIDISFNANQK